MANESELSSASTTAQSKSASRGSVASVYFNRRMGALLGLGVASGLPFMLTTDSLSAWMTKSNVDVKTIGLFSLVGLPYAFKFLWAPAMDRFMPPLLGRRRGWLVVTQLVLMLAIMGMAWTGPDQLKWVAFFAMAVAFFSASQDIVADAYRSDVLHERELGAGAALFVAGYRMAMICSGAGVLLLAGWIGWELAFTAMAVLMGLCTVVTFFAPEPEVAVAPPLSMREAVRDPLAAFARGRAQWRVVALFAFVLLFKLPDTLANRMTMPFLLDAMHYATTDVGVIRQFAGLWVTIVGTIVGGLIVAKIGVIRSLWVFGVLQAVSNSGFLALAWLGPEASSYGPVVDGKQMMELSTTSVHYLALTGVVVIESFCGGLVAAGFIAFLMSQCDRRYSATQYALLTSFMVFTGMIAAAFTGYLVADVGYLGFFALTIAAGIPGMALIVLLPPVRTGKKSEAAAA